MSHSSARTSASEEKYTRVRLQFMSKLKAERLREYTQIVSDYHVRKLKIETPVLNDIYEASFRRDRLYPYTLGLFPVDKTVTFRRCVINTIFYLKERTDNQDAAILCKFWFKLVQLVFWRFHCRTPGVKKHLQLQINSLLRSVEKNLRNGWTNLAIELLEVLNLPDHPYANFRELFRFPIDRKDAVTIFNDLLPDPLTCKSPKFVIPSPLCYLPNPEHYMPSSPIRTELEPLLDTGLRADNGPYFTPSRESTLHLLL